MRRNPGEIRPIGPHRLKIRDRIKRKARNGDPRFPAPIAVVAVAEKVPFSVGDAVRYQGRRGTVSAVRPGEVAIRGIVGWVACDEVDPEEE